ncbi:MAG: alpha/beta hydrolase [Microbacteriaceae bacterium]|nr:alpha/beta hydrolase [Microbacteriaceae bacterium]
MSSERIHGFSRAGLTFEVTDEGPLDGPVVVLLHGFPAHRGAWRLVTPFLTAAGIRTLAPNQRGYSPGAAPLERSRYRGNAIALDVLALLDAAGVRRAHVVGHDWGGFVAWRLASRAPGRLSGVTVLSTPHPSALLPSSAGPGQLVRLSYMGFFQLPCLPEAVLRPALSGLLMRSGLPHPFAEDYATFMSTGTTLRCALNWYRGMWLPSARTTRIGAALVPTTYVWGSRDQALGRRAAEGTADHVDAPYRFVELDENHWLPERAPERVAAEIIRGAVRSPHRTTPHSA